MLYSYPPQTLAQSPHILFLYQASASSKTKGLRHKHVSEFVQTAVAFIPFPRGVILDRRGGEERKRRLRDRGYQCCVKLSALRDQGNGEMLKIN